MVKNESEHLEKCLTSLVPVLEALDSELIIVDTGSTDNTVEIAKKFTDKVYFHEWNNDFSEMRNIVVSYAKGEWFFFVDGDEILNDAQDVIEFFKTERHKNVNSAFIEIRNAITRTNVEQYTVFHALRFFRRDKDFRFVGIIHEQPQAKGPFAKIGGHIFHYGYINDDKELMEYKFKRNVELIEKALAEEPSNIYHLYQLSQSYAMYGNYNKALGPIEKAYRLAKKKGLQKYMNVINHLANVYFGNQMFVDCETVCTEGLRLRDGYIDLYYFKAMSLAELGRLRESVSTFEKYLSLVDAYEQGKAQIDLSLAHISVGYREHAYKTLFNIHRKLGEYQQAIEYAHKVTTPQLIKDVVCHLIDIYYKLGDIQRIRELYDKWMYDEYAKRIIKVAIENKRMNMDENERIELSRLFADVEDAYGLLNVARNYCTSNLERIPSGLWQKIASTDLSNREVYYGDFVYLFIKHEKAIVDLLSGVRNDKITAYFMYLFRTYKDFLEVSRTYFDNEKLWTIKGDDAQVYRIKTAALYGLLQHNSLPDKDYEYLFHLYLEAGIKYIEACYNPRVLDIGDISWARTAADGFLFIMRKANSMRKRESKYVQYLREALITDSSMTRGIEILLQEAKKGLEFPEREEFEILKTSVQEAIRNAINQGELENAVTLINEYEKIVGVDAPLCAFKGIMFMIEGNHEEARNTFLLGLQLEPDNEDLLYNLNYIDSL